MSIMRPGKFDITDKAMEQWDLPKGAKVLEIGCGEGDTAQHLKDKYGFEVTGMDISLDMVDRAKKAHPGIEFMYGDGEILDSFMSFTFDGIVMECVLSLINLADEALHEAYCVMKKGAKIFISDLYMRDPDPEQVKAIKIEADRIAKIPHQEGECDDAGKSGELRFLDFRFEGRFIEEPLIRQMEEIGFTNIKFEDRTDDLIQYVGQKIFDEGKD
ncbi:MAG: methyltransferase domain-containing protein, partial [Firmicutes bacterium]|nr:methyltransferase domain-containing protein [Bacillota bacterium]